MVAKDEVDVPSALERTRLELEVLVRNSLTIQEAAKALRVSTSRIRQRLSSKHPTLYGIKEGHGWRIPRFQFESKGHRSGHAARLQLLELGLELERLGAPQPPREYFAYT